MSWPKRFLLTNMLLNFLSRPDFIAYSFHDRKGLSPRLCSKIWGAQPVSWTLRCREDYDVAVAEGNFPIFEGFEI